MIFFLFNFQTVSNREIEIQTEDEQTFLARQQQLLMQGQTPMRGESPLRSQTGGKSSPRTPGSGTQGSPNKKVTMNKTYFLPKKFILSILIMCLS